MDYQQRAIELVSTRFPEALLRTAHHNGQYWVEVDRARIVDVLRMLKEEGPFEFLMDLTCVDWLGRIIRKPEPESPSPGRGGLQPSAGPRNETAEGLRPDSAPNGPVAGLTAAKLPFGSVDGETARADGKPPGSPDGKRPSGIPIPTPESAVALERFSIVYQLYSLSTNTHFRVKTWVPDADPECDSIGDMWKSAPWGEREVWDQYGVRFRGLKDHRRILNPMDYTGHPLRKDYPLIGHGERSSFPHYVK